MQMNSNKTKMQEFKENAKKFAKRAVAGLAIAGALAYTGAAVQEVQAKHEMFTPRSLYFAFGTLSDHSYNSFTKSNHYVLTTAEGNKVDLETKAPYFADKLQAADGGVVRVGFTVETGKEGKLVANKEDGRVCMVEAEGSYPEEFYPNNPAGGHGPETNYSTLTNN